jgi:hypothetical protein
MSHDSYDDKFPPNKWLKKTIMKTPERFGLCILGLVASFLISVKFFPHQVSVVAYYFMFAWLPFVFVMMVWWVIWIVKNPPPPPRYCETCHQRLPYQDDHE